MTKFTKVVVKVTNINIANDEIFDDVCGVNGLTDYYVCSDLCERVFKPLCVNQDYEILAGLFMSLTQAGFIFEVTYKE